MPVSEAFRKCVAYVGSGRACRFAAQSRKAPGPNTKMLTAVRTVSAALHQANVFHCLLTTKTGNARARNGLNAMAAAAHAPAARGREERAASQALVTRSAASQDTCPRRNATW